jgi:hypothetical protein
MSNWRNARAPKWSLYDAEGRWPCRPFDAAGVSPRSMNIPHRSDLYGTEVLDLCMGEPNTPSSDTLPDLTSYALPLARPALIEQSILTF